MINLHAHSNHSLDGNVEVNKLLKEAEKNNINYISVTDHDTCACYGDIKLNGYKGTIIYGIEADAVINDTTYDILCYGFKLNEINTWAKEQYGTVQTRQTKIYNRLIKLCQEKNIKFDDEIKFNPDIEFAHGALFRMLDKDFLKKYNINTIGDLYREGTQNKQFPLYIDMNFVWPKIEDLRELIHKNNGKLFLAHPFEYGKEKNVEQILEEAKPYIDGIEIYNDNTKEETEFLYNYAKKNNLLISVGSDYHGSDKHNTLETKYVTEEMEKEILAWINKLNGKITL